MFSKLLAGSTIALSLGNVLAAGVAWGGVNIAGFDFGCDTSGNCQQTNVDPPIDGPNQMKHFVNDDKLNMFRLNVGWQFLVNSQLGGTLDAANLAKYDTLVQGCLTTGAYCIIDIHNYARWNGQIIGQGGPTDDQFASLWSQLATKYAKESKIVMGLMNEPHDMPDMTRWATSVQAAVTAIRKAGATSQNILLPGNDYTSAAAFATGSGPALSKVTNLDGSTTNLIFDVHQYYDADNSGTHVNCVGNQIDGAFAPLATWLRANKRQALLSETGGGSNDASCLTNICDVLDFLNQNSDVYLGYLGWSAGAFSPDSYVLSLTPKPSINGDHGYTDQPLMKQCFAAKFAGGSGTVPVPAPGPASPISSAPASAAVSSNAAQTFAPVASASASPPAPNVIPSGVFPPGRASGTGAAPYPTSYGSAKELFIAPAGWENPPSVPTTLSTAVKPSSTSQSPAEETGAGEPDDETCEA